VNHKPSAKPGDLYADTTTASMSTGWLAFGVSRPGKLGRATAKLVVMP
jgi:hypothetical protein